MKVDIRKRYPPYYKSTLDQHEPKTKFQKELWKEHEAKLAKVIETGKCPCGASVVYREDKDFENDDWKKLLNTIFPKIDISDHRKFIKLSRELQNYITDLGYLYGIECMECR